MPSAKFTLIGRRASSRNRCFRTASAFAAGDDSACLCPSINKMLAREGHQQIVACLDLLDPENGDSLRAESS
jgi:hypothetical protein